MEVEAEGDGLETLELRCRICVLLRRSAGKVRRVSSGVRERGIGGVSTTGTDTARASGEGRDLLVAVELCWFVQPQVVLE